MDKPRVTIEYGFPFNVARLDKKTEDQLEVVKDRLDGAGVFEQGKSYKNDVAFLFQVIEILRDEIEFQDRKFSELVWRGEKDDIKKQEFMMQVAKLLEDNGYYMNHGAIG